MLKLGDKIINKLYLGNKVISKAYLGDKLVYKKAGGRFVKSILFDGASFIDTGIAHQTCDVECCIRFEENGTRQLMGFGSSTAQYWGKPANSVTLEGLSGYYMKTQDFLFLHFPLSLSWFHIHVNI